MNRINATGPAERNKAPIFECLAPLLSNARRVLEIGAGNGTHARHAAYCLPHVHWQPSEHPRRMACLQQGLAGHARVATPLALDVGGDWPRDAWDAVYAANVAHIMSWPAVEALFAGTAGVLVPTGLLCLYGPFFDDDVVTGEGNRAFDRRLRQRDAGMGLRRVQALDALAREHGLARSHDWTMPANNRLLAWRLQAV